ncbi:GLYL3 protein, partial [Caloenas nicobarica]|nr:GLYL3 protein [Caloenas nicobarica]
MLILTCPAQLQRLEATLRRSLPLALPVLGAVMNINRGNPAEFEVAVDSWPDFGAVLARHSGKVAMGDVAGGHGDLASGRNWGAGQHWGQELGYWGWRPGLWGAPGDIGEGTAGVLGLDPDVRVGSLSPAHVDLLNETWPYGGNDRSRQYLAEVLRLFPNLCLQDKAGQPISWALTNHFGMGTHGYTLPSHRRRGYMQAVMILAARRAQAHGYPSFG